MTMQRQEESGFVLVIIIILLLPMLLVVGAFSVAMTGRTNELRVELNTERALLAAEAGVDSAIYRGQTGKLVDGETWERTLGPGVFFEATPTYLKADGLDNDNDGQTDEADEDVFQVVVLGVHNSTERRVAAYLGPISLLPPIKGPLTVENQNVALDLRGSSLVSGFDILMDGTPTGKDVPAISITPPGTTADLLAELNGSEQPKVVGFGGTPSLATTPFLDLVSAAALLQNIANLVLTSDKYASFNFGDGPGGVANITYREGDVMFNGNTQGAGILVVTGNLRMLGNFRFDGVVIVLGDVRNSAGTAEVYGAILQGPGASIVQGKGNLMVRYCEEAIGLSNATSGDYVAFNGWQELAK